MSSLFDELKRRHVTKVVTSYAVISWLLIQVIVAIEAPLGLPEWADTFVIVTLVMGFPVCAVLAWLYDFTARGIERTADVEAVSPSTTATGATADKWMLAFSVAAVALLLATSAHFVIGNSPPATTTLAILSFEQIGDDAETRYLGDGIRDSLITRLSRIGNLRIKSSDAGLVDDRDAQRLGRLVRADVICAGTVEQRGDTLEIVAQLFSADDGSIIWRERYSSQASSLIAIEREISTAITEQLRLSLTSEDLEVLARASTENPAAHRLYLQGRYFWNRRTTEGFAASIDYYTRALALDPNYALAHAGLADTYLMLLGWGMDRPGVLAPRVVKAAEDAIRLDASLAEPHAALGYLKTLYDRDWDGAQREFLRAIELNSNYSSAHHWYAFLLMTKGDIDAALEEIRLARESEPLSPIINAEVGYFYLFAEDYEHALEELENARLLDPNYASTLSHLLRAYAVLGRDTEASQILERWRSVVGTDVVPAAFGAMPLPLLGLEDEARQIYSRLIETSHSQYVYPGLLGMLAGVLGDRDAAFTYFDDALEERSLVVSWLRDPLLVRLRDDPRFAEIFESVGLEL